MSQPPNISFVCCVESGWLEDQVIRMVESLRRWGGRFADAPVFAVSPRRGLPLSSQTLKAFEKLNIRYLQFNQPTEYEWFPYLNKPRSLVIAEPHIKTELVGYLDADVIVVGEPNQFILQEGEDFAGCVTDAIGGSKGSDDPLDPYWKDVCKTLEVDINALPWVKTELERERIRIHWNGGIFVYRRASNFAHAYYQAATKVLQSQVSSKICGIFFNEQVAMAVSVIQQGLSWRNLPLSHNHEIESSSYPDDYDPDRFKEARIVHYHNCMWSDFMDEFVRCMKTAHPEVAEWLVSIGPMQNKAPELYKLMGRLIQTFRKWQQSNYEKYCRVV
jgi:hypothetical protein